MSVFWPGNLMVTDVPRHKSLYRFLDFLSLFYMYIYFYCTAEVCSFIDISKIVQFVFVFVHITLRPLLVSIIHLHVYYTKHAIN